MPGLITWEEDGFMQRSLMTIFFLSFVVFPCRAFGASLCCQLPGGVQESIFGVLAPEPSQLSMQLTYSFTLMDKLKQGGSGRSAEEVANTGRYLTIPTEMEMTRYTLTAAYRFTPKLSAFVAIPYIRNTMDMVAAIDMGAEMGMAAMGLAMESVNALGDVTVMGLYRIYENDENRPADVVTFGLGVKTPTGSSTKKNSGGRFVHAHMQPGTGSWDPLLSIIYSKKSDPLLFQTDVTYQIATRNSEGYKFGDSFTANLLGKYAVSSLFNVTGGLTYLHQNRASDREGKYTDLTSLMDDPANTGEDSIWLSPGIQVLPLKNGLVDLKVQLPLWQRVKGVQLVSRYRILVGFSYSF